MGLLALFLPIIMALMTTIIITNYLILFIVFDFSELNWEQDRQIVEASKHRLPLTVGYVFFLNLYLASLKGVISSEMIPVQIFY